MACAVFNFNEDAGATLASTPVINSNVRGRRVSADDLGLNNSALSGISDLRGGEHVFDDTALLGRMQVDATGIWNFDAGSAKDGTHDFTAISTDLFAETVPN